MNLVCSRRWLVSATQSAYMFGRMVGATIYGHLSDRFGRRPSLMLSVVLSLLACTSLAWISNVYLFLIVRFFSGIQTTGEFQIAFVIGRTFSHSHVYETGTFGQITWSVGLVILSLIAYFVRERFWLQVTLSFPLSLLLLIFFFVPESPRFLLSAGRKDECIKHLRKMAKINNVEFPADVEHQLKADRKVKNFTLLDLFQYPNIRRSTFLLMAAWSFSGSFVYYGLSLNATSISGDPYLNFFLSALVEVPAYALAVPLLSRLGRIQPISGCYLAVGLLMFISIFISNDILVTILSTLGKGLMTCGYGMVYITTAELYPTRLRSIGFGTCIISARFAATLAPFTSDLLAVWRHLPSILFSAIALISSCLVQFLPDASDQPLPQTLEEGELFNSSGKRCPVWSVIDTSHLTLSLTCALI
ncbi:hypothetical protein HELRODRAFT_90057 [Helobdella robusta]|uniref:Major facilitator superfamily (MFS) profile domain-containing protein n=1 Tax=Helobdella robusta TaxID=6412 RepID=T1G7K4_HELRO|nr:hypothetical protein HELRODRAFT_90057 [Helobdella robusta]ESN92020.1 hypothetical protein HELRODRAFT_90057 [Helobdella robusta]